MEHSVIEGPPPDQNRPSLFAVLDFPRAAADNSLSVAPIGGMGTAFGTLL
jgi:hypothetical protein